MHDNLTSYFKSPSEEENIQNSKHSLLTRARYLFDKYGLNDTAVFTEEAMANEPWKLQNIIVCEHLYGTTKKLYAYRCSLYVSTHMEWGVLQWRRMDPSPTAST